jgi:hypothetical protein
LKQLIELSGMQVTVEQGLTLTTCRDLSTILHSLG